MQSKFISGIIEGFYGRPWTWMQRLSLIDTLADHGLNTYMYAPKFDLHHRNKWTEPYPDTTIHNFSNLCLKGKEKNINVILALSPGLTLSENNVSLLIDRFRELASLEPAGLALLLDDIPYNRASVDIQSDILCTLVEAIPDNTSWFFCPTAYSGYHLRSWNQASSYLTRIGERLPPDINIFWTGHSVVSRKIAADDLQWIHSTLRRKPVIWDNFPADDYVPANMVFPGPLTGRSFDVLNTARGLLLNPSQVFCISQMAVFHLAAWIESPETYSPDKAFHQAVVTLAAQPEAQDVLFDLFEYFYTPFDVSPRWLHRLTQFELYYREPQSSVSPATELEGIRSRLRHDHNIELLGDIWLELYPFARTLMGDLDYLIDACQRIEQTGRPFCDLPWREPRWSTPVMDTLFRILTNKPLNQPDIRE